MCKTEERLEKCNGICELLLLKKAVLILLRLFSTLTVLTIASPAQASSPAIFFTDLTSGTGEKVASGLYVYLMTTDNGLRKRGQIAVIH